MINRFNSATDNPEEGDTLSFSTQSSIEDILKNFKVSDRYEHLTEVGQGGMGIITLARDKYSLRKVAVKTLKSDLLKSHEAILRFSEEAQITAQLEHPNIVPVYELGINSENAPFYSMKYIRGTNLKEILRLLKSGNGIVKRKFHKIELLSIFIKVCDVMAFACSKGVLHRDLKPENIMVGEFGEVLVVDWGLAKTFTKKNISDSQNCYIKLTRKIDSFIEDNIDTIRTLKNIHLSMDNCLIGTPQYMPPERIIGEGDERSEVYTLGIILYELLSLDNMFKGADVKEVLHKIIEGTKTPLSIFHDLPHIMGGKVPQALIAVVEKATNTDSTERYQSINELRSEIESYVLGFATKAESAGFFRLLKLATMRNKKLSCLITLLVTSLILISGIFIYDLSHSKQNAVNKSRNANLLKKSALQKTHLVEMKSKELKERITELKKHSETLLGNARAEADAANYENALNSIQQAINLDEEVGLYYLFKGKLLLSLMQFDLAIEALQRLKIDYALYESNQSYFEICKEMINKTSNKQLSNSYTLKLFKFFKERGDYTEAITVLKKLTKTQDYDRLLKDIWMLKLMKTPLAKSFASHKVQVAVNKGKFSITLKDPDLYDLSPLASMPIKDLFLSNCRISTLLPLKNMPLERLIIEDINISDLSPLKDLNLLYELKLKNCPIEDLTPLKSMKLRIIFINKCPVAFLDPLKNMELEEVVLDHSLVKSISPLINQPIRYFSANNTRIENLEPLHGMPLKFLMLNNTSINDLSPIEDADLECLEIKGTFVRQIKKLNLSSLKRIYLSGTAIKEINFLKNAKFLRFIEIRNSQITSLEPLRDQKLLKVYIENNAIKDVSPVANKELRELYLSSCFTDNLTSLQRSRKLEVLFADNCGISNIQALKGLPLKNLNLSYNPLLNDCTALTVNYLEELNLEQTGVKDLNFLKDSPIRNLNIKNTNVHDISVLTTTQNLQTLKMLGSKNIQSVSYLQKLHKLNSLSASPFIPDLYLLKEHQSLKQIKISNTQRNLKDTWNIYDKKYQRIRNEN